MKHYGELDQANSYDGTWNSLTLVSLTLVFHMTWKWKESKFRNFVKKNQFLGGKNFRSLSNLEGPVRKNSRNWTKIAKPRNFLSAKLSSLNVIQFSKKSTLLALIIRGIEFRRINFRGWKVPRTVQFRGIRFRGWRKMNGFRGI